MKHSSSVYILIFLCFVTCTSCSVTFVLRSFTGDTYQGSICEENTCECRDSKRTLASYKQKVECVSYQNIADCTLGYHELDLQGSPLTIQKNICAENNPKISDVFVWDMFETSGKWRGKWQSQWNQTFKEHMKLQYEHITVDHDNNYWGGLLLQIWITCGGTTQCALAKFYGRRYYPLRPQHILEEHVPRTTTTPSVVTKTVVKTHKPDDSNDTIYVRTIVPAVAAKENGNNAQSPPILAIILTILLAFIFLLLLLCIILLRKRLKRKQADAATQVSKPLHSTTAEVTHNTSTDELYTDEKYSLMEGLVALSVDDKKQTTDTIRSNESKVIDTDSNDHNNIRYTCQQTNDQSEPVDYAI